MKKIIYIITAGLLVLAVACNKTIDVDSPSNTTTVPPAEGTLVKVEFTVSYPGSSSQTKSAMADKPDIKSLYLAIFSEDNGYLQNWIPAKFVALEQAGVEYEKKYEVYLPITDNKVFHFIADPPVKQPTFDYENNFMKSMVTTGSESAYWQRIVVPGGVKAAKKANGEYLLDDAGNYTVDYNSIKGLKHVTLVRNFARINVQSADPTQFTVLQYALGNVPKSGTVAPMNSSLTTDGKESFDFNVLYTSIRNYLPPTTDVAISQDDPHFKGNFYKALANKTDAGYTGYVGIMPTDVEFNTAQPTTFVQASDTDNGLYTYERTLPTTEFPTTVILMQIRWTSGNSNNFSGDQWYKIELLDSDGDQMPILRNILYTLSLSGIKDKGYSSAETAWNNAAFGNISSSLETAALNEISDGTSKIWVEKLDYTIFTNVTNTTLEFQFYPDENSTTTVNKTDATKNVEITVSRREVSGYNHAVSNKPTETNVTVTEDGYGSIPITLNPIPTSGMLKSIIRVQGRYSNNRPIYREVTYTVMPQQDFDASKTKVVGTTDAINQQVTVTIGLPEGLASDVFPLQIRIEADKNNLSTTNPDLPVQDGESAFSTTGGRSFYYIKTISFTEYRTYNTETESYDYHTEYPCVFTTTKASNAGTKIHLSCLDENNQVLKPTTITLNY